VSEQDDTQITPLHHPAVSDKEAWQAYWEAQGQLWRTEPEIDAERQTYLVERQNIIPNITQGMYPFKDIKLNRADVEWLLATFDGGRGPISASEEIARHTRGLDLRGADLRGVDLNRLPLVQIRGGLSIDAWYHATHEQREAAAVHLEGANLTGADLTRASLRSAHLEGADLVYVCLEGTVLRSANLAGNSTKLRPANLQHTLMNHETDLQEIILGNNDYGFVRVADVFWGDVNLAVVDWTQVSMLGDEYAARLRKPRIGMKERRLQAYQTAVRANRQLASVLQAQGLNEDAARFAYRAQKLQRAVLLQQKKSGSYLFSGFLDLLAGYGYRPRRSFICYLLVVVAFSLTFYVFGHLPLLPDALVFSLTSFHGRGFFPGLGNQTSLHNPLVVLAAIEAVIGLFIEISFIATFTRRFFGS
jgi:uncharacterized protein YjbI with pentapeptide repeats